MRTVNRDAAPSRAQKMMGKPAVAEVAAPETRMVSFEPVAAVQCERCGTINATLYARTKKLLFYHCLRASCHNLFTVWREAGGYCRESMEWQPEPGMREAEFTYQDTRLSGLLIHLATGMVGGESGNETYLVRGAASRNYTVDPVAVAEALMRGDGVKVTLLPVAPEITQTELHAKKLEMIAGCEAHAVSCDTAANAQAQEAMKNGPASAWDKVWAHRQIAKNARIEAENLKKMTDEEAEDAARRKVGLGPRGGLKR
jgi:hypothetical protein